MIKPQIQLPDDLYYKVRDLAREKELSFAEVCRRGLEYMLHVYPPGSLKADNWTLPEPRRLGKPKIHHSEWRLLANESVIGGESVTPRRPYKQ